MVEAEKKLSKLYPPDAANELQSVITVRLPKSVHSALIGLSHDNRNSMNYELCELVKRHLEESGCWPYAEQAAGEGAPPTTHEATHDAAPAPFKGSAPHRLGA